MLRNIVATVLTLFILSCSLQAQEIPKAVTNSIGMKLVLIPHGTFMMGSPRTEKEREDDETKHEVTISRDYFLGVTEVTQGQYEKVVGRNYSYYSNFRRSAKIEIKDTSNHPVEMISWTQAAEFCKRLSDLPEEKQEGRVYRLPTEAEWEYACRAGSTNAYSFGDSPELIGDYAWYEGNSNDQTHPVGKKKPNAFGLYDMHGNVWEWCNDRYKEYPRVSVTNPVGPTKGKFRVFRGGSWVDGIAGCRSASRLEKSFVIGFSTGGFRVALSASTAPK